VNISISICCYRCTHTRRLRYDIVVTLKGIFAYIVLENGRTLTNLGATMVAEETVNL